MTPPSSQSGEQLDRDVLAQAQLLMDSFVAHHRQPAIPALIAACVCWAVEHGGADVVKGSLTNAIHLTNDLAQVMRRQAQ